MTITKKILTCLMLVLVVLTISGCPKKYAVLISTNQVSYDDIGYHSVWWYDVVLMYKMLLENGFNENNIYVLYADGNDFNSKHNCYNSTIQFGHTITDYPNNKTNIQNIFSWLASGNAAKGIKKVDSDDFLFVWWMGHGGGSGAGMCDLSMEITNTGQHVSDTELESYLNGITTYDKRTILIMTCHAGGMLDNLNVVGTNTVTITSSTCVENSYEGNDTYDVNHAEFTYEGAAALRTLIPSSTSPPCDSASPTCNSDANPLISLQECYSCLSTRMTTSTPQIANPDVIAATTHIKDDSP